MDIAIIDDDPHCRSTLAGLLRRAGFEVVAQLSDGMEALALLEQIQVDLLITDCQMPRMDGLTLTRCLRSAGQPLPIIMISGHVDPSIAAQAKSAGVSAFFSKPLQAKDLLEFIHRHVPVAA